ncbi:MAG: MmcQ/YjbR family DNA-binding protein [Bacteroidota bacterium]|nr:MmcQ/YjbR family DNA-binding protein [Bacteroidota bacterium]
MISIKAITEFALSFEGAVEQPHFEITSFRVNKKIFASLDIKKKRLCVKLSAIDQSVFCSFDNTIIYPVPNKWGLQGATYIELSKVPVSMCKDALTSSYCLVALKKMRKFLRHSVCRGEPLRAKNLPNWRRVFSREPSRHLSHTRQLKYTNS